MTDQEKLFIESCYENKFSSIKMCIKYNVNIHVENDWCIDIVARKGYSKLVKFFLENGITHESASEKMVLAYTCDNQDLDLVKYLIENHEYKKEHSALSWAAATGNMEIIELLLGYFDEFDGVFCSAAQSGQVNVLNFLIDNGIQDLDSGSERAPYWAAEKNKWNVVELLLSNGIGSLENLGENYTEMFLSWRENKY